ncbi:MAG: transposase [Flavobacterium sp.]|jgi:REP element-mobilizing transposase RayT|nr:transposase [Flavobacterium sp.]
MKQEKFEYDTFFHVYNRGNNKEDIFKEDKNYSYFLKLAKQHLLDVAEIYAYCLLKNHFHIVLRIKDRDEIPEKYVDKIHIPFSNLFNAYSKAMNKAYNRTGSLFQEHLKRNKIKDENYLINLILYVHLNPVKHKFCDDFRTYKFSSYLSYISDKPSSLHRDYILELFGGKSNFIYQHKESKIKYEDVVNEIDNFDY